MNLWNLDEQVIYNTWLNKMIAAERHYFVNLELELRWLRELIFVYIYEPR